MTDIKIDADAMNQIVTKAILEGIDANQREAIMEQAVQSLLAAPKRDRYSSEPALTPLQSAFDMAVGQLVRTVAREVVEESAELRDKVRALVADAMAAALDESTALQAKVASAVAEAVLENRR